MSLSVPLDKGERVRIRCRMGRLFVTMVIVCVYIFVGMRGDKDIFFECWENDWE